MNEWRSEAERRGERYCAAELFLLCSLCEEVVETVCSGEMKTIELGIYCARLVIDKTASLTNLYKQRAMISLKAHRWP